jgi:molecular chaperone HtpG
VVTVSELIKNASDACLYKNDTIRVEIDTVTQTITVKDNGSGFSMADIESLRHPGRSLKMTHGNYLSKIGEPYAGNKGLGILTAFNLCTHLEITTFSAEDNCAYKIEWRRGTAEINVSEIEQTFSGTRLVLFGVSDSDLKLLTDDEELKKLFISSITYYVDSKSLPSIKFYLNGKDVTLTPDVKIEQIYTLNNKLKAKKQGFFCCEGNV